MREQLIRRAKELNISDIGFVSAEVTYDLCLSLRGAEEKNVFSFLPETKTVIVCFVSYYTDVPGSRISRYARGKDYHIVVKERMEQLSELLRKNGFLTKVFCDAWGLNERYLAQLAGLGFIGKNRMLIHPKFGSYGFLGCILTDCRMEPSEPLAQKSCMECGACLRACPGRALSEGGFCPERCASYLTQERRELTGAEQEIVFASGMLWGCDRCQEVCPHNQSLPETVIPEFRERLISEPELLDSDRMFRKKYAEYAFSWRGKKPLERNQKLLDSEKNSTKNNIM